MDNKLSEETEIVGFEDSASDINRERIRGAGWLEIAPGERVCLPVYFRCVHEMVERRIQRANAAFIRLRGDVYEAATLAIADAKKARGTSEEDVEDEIKEEG